MFCSKCGKEIPESARFCGNCGATVGGADNVTKAGAVGNSFTNLKDTVQEKETKTEKETETETEVTYMAESAYSTVFVEPDEQLLGTLGNGYLENILGKKVKKAHALLTNKRVYFQGTFFSGSGKNLQQDIAEKIVDLEDITGTGFRYNKPIGFLRPIIMTVIMGVLGWFIDLFLLGFGGATGAVLGILIPILIYIIKYLLNRKVYFILEYAGGAIRFDATIVGLSNVKDFNKQIRRAKDHAKETK
jgi:hypothetical protein